MGVLGHPVDEAGRQQQPLQLGGAVVEGEAELGHPGLGVGRGVLVDAGQHLARGVLQPGGQRCPGVDRRREAVGAGVEGDGSLEPGERGQTGRGQLGRSSEHPARGIGQTEGRGRVHVPVHLAHAVGGLIGVEGTQLARRETRWRVGQHHAVEVAHRPGGERRERDGLGAVGPGGGDGGVGHALAAQRRLPRRSGRVRRPRADQEHVEIELHRGGRRRAGDHGHRAGRHQDHQGAARHRLEPRRLPEHGRI